MKRALPLLCSFALLVALQLSLRPPAPAQARSISPEVTATISGRVTRADTGAPLAGILVDACRHDAPDIVCGPVATVSTGADGTYTFASIKADAYYIRFRDPAGYWATTFWPGGAAIFLGQMLDLNNGGTRTGVDAALVPGSTVRGTVTASDGKPIDEVTVYLWLPGSLIPWAAADYLMLRGSGEYVFPALGPGDYRLQYFTRESRLFGEWWDNSTDNYGAHPLDLTPGVTLTADVELRAGGLITGVVRGAGELPAARVALTVWSVGADGPVEVSQWADSDSLGRFRLGPLDGGTYLLRAVDLNDFYADVFHPGVLWWEDATSFTVSAGEVLSDVSFRLRPEDGLGEAVIYLPVGR